MTTFTRITQHLEGLLSKTRGEKKIETSGRLPKLSGKKSRACPRIPATAELPDNDALDAVDDGTTVYYDSSI